MKINHIALYVSDLEGAREFFEKYFGGKSNNLYHNINTGFRSYFLSFEDGSRLELMNKPDVADRDKSLAMMGYAHISFSVGSRENVDALTAQLAAAGYSVAGGPRTTGGGHYESSIIGFEGNRIEITI